MSDVLTIKLTAREPKLILRYGYPFDEIDRQLRSSCTKRGRVGISDAAYWWEQVVGNLAITVNEDVEDEELLGELNELCDKIESYLGVHNRQKNRP